MTVNGGAVTASTSVLDNHPKKAVASILVGSFLFLDFSIGTVRHAILNPAEAGATLDRQYRIESSRYHHDLSPNVDSQPAIFGSLHYTISTNSLGLKDEAPREILLEPERRRILFIGDSFTEGLGFPYERTFVGIIDQRLREEGIEVLNAGVASYSPMIYVRKVRYLVEDIGLRFNELIVFIDVSDIVDDSESYRIGPNDEVLSAEQQGVELPEESRSFRTFVRENTIVTGPVLETIRSWFFDVSRNGRVGRERSLWTVDDELFQRFGATGLGNMRQAMDDLVALARLHGFDLTIAVYPWPDQIVHSDMESRHVIFWRDWADEKNVAFMNFFPDFIGPNASETLDEFFIRRDVHWNERGHQYMAELFLRSRDTSQ